MFCVLIPFHQSQRSLDMSPTCGKFQTVVTLVVACGYTFREMETCICRGTQRSCDITSGAVLRGPVTTLVPASISET
uniref:Uncharacterized protein n=1 Tax=Anguilla anguilla TaxID=7936 RepID=A0A0E9WKE0_ANGAN